MHSSELCGNCTSSREQVYYVLCASRRCCHLQCWSDLKYCHLQCVCAKMQVCQIKALEDSIESHSNIQCFVSDYTSMYTVYTAVKQKIFRYSVIVKMCNIKSFAFYVFAFYKLNVVPICTFTVITIKGRSFYYFCYP